MDLKGSRFTVLPIAIVFDVLKAIAESLHVIHMKVYCSHVELTAKNDPTPQCAGRLASQPESPSRHGRHVAFRLPYRGDQGDRRAANPGGVARTAARPEAGDSSARYCSTCPRRARSAVIVLDASAAIDWLLQTSAGERIERRIYSRGESLHAPHLLDLEVAQVLRRLVRESAVSAPRADHAIQDLMSLRVARYPHIDFLPYIWRMRHNLSAYDAAYLALAQELGATLITRDARLASGFPRGLSFELF
jgi:predicted nucleic acid-binding protein